MDGFIQINGISEGLMQQGSTLMALIMTEIHIGQHGVQLISPMDPWMNGFNVISNSTVQKWSISAGYMPSCCIELPKLLSLLRHLFFTFPMPLLMYWVNTLHTPKSDIVLVMQPWKECCMHWGVATFVCITCAIWHWWNTSKASRNLISGKKFWANNTSLRDKPNLDSAMCSADGMPEAILIGQWTGVEEFTSAKKNLPCSWWLSNSLAFATGWVSKVSWIHGESF